MLKAEALDEPALLHSRPNVPAGVGRAHRIPELDGLRAIAILLVLGCHFPAFATSLGGLPELGWVGVDVFFVLSGFLITSILLGLKGKQDSYFLFLTRRAVRIMPPYFLVLVIVLGISKVAHLSDPSRLPAQSLYYGLFLSSTMDSFAYLSRSWDVVNGTIAAIPIFSSHVLPLAHRGFLATDLPDTLRHFWSVSVEEWYYVLWAPIVLGLSRRAITLSACFLAALAFICRWFGFTDWQWYVTFCCRVDMLAAGGLLALWHERRPSLTEESRLRGDRLLSAAAIIASLCCLLLVFNLRPFLGREIRAAVSFAAFGPVLIAVMVAGLLGSLLRHPKKTMIGKACGHPVLAYIGRRSYMIYLLHLPVYFGVCRLVPNLWLAAGLSACTCLFLAALSWRFFEGPLLSLRDRPRNNPPMLPKPVL